MSHWEPPSVQNPEPGERPAAVLSGHRILLKISALLGVAMLVDYLANG